MDSSEAQAIDENGDASRTPYFQSLERFNAFSDGVFAIAITLLVLELPVPPEGAPLLPLILESWVDFLGYFISFAFIGGIWLSHAALTKGMKQGDAVSFRLNLIMLLFVSLLPFTTNVMVTHMAGTDTRAAVTIYGLNLMVAGGVLTALMRYVAGNPYLVINDITDDQIKRAFRQRRVYLALQALVVVVGLVAPLVAVGSYVVLTVAFIIQPLILAKPSHR